jgi:peptidoglycan/LPS O-acetylase OafA/YrhL
MNARLYTLDYLRGLSAFGIMVYHFLYWLQGPFSANQFLGRVGVYGVALFYVLSGLTLYHVYDYANIGHEFSWSTFFKKRFYRIFPLLWLATICAIILSRKQPNPLDLLLNLTGMFGFISWDVTFTTGGWSI